MASGLYTHGKVTVHLLLHTTVLFLFLFFEVGLTRVHYAIGQCTADFHFIHIIVGRDQSHLKHWSWYNSGVYDLGSLSRY